MGKIYVIIAAAAIAASVNAHGESGKPFFPRKFEVPRSAQNVAKLKSSSYMPLHIETYGYIDGVWEFLENFYLEYDGRGNVLVQTSDQGQDATQKRRRTFTYNSDDLVTETISEILENDQRFSATRETRAYDPVVKDLVVELASFLLRNDQWEQSTRFENYKRDVTRDARGNVTEVVYSTWNGDVYVPSEKYTVTYDEQGVARTWRYEVANASGDWEEQFTFSEMEWLKTDGQIVDTDYTTLFGVNNNNNVLKSANMVMYGFPGSLTATYDETGATDDYTLEMITRVPLEDGEMVQREVDVYTYTDGNGSLKVTRLYYMDANGDGEYSEYELMMTSEYTDVYDDYGNMTLSEARDNGELSGGEKYEYVYDDSKGVWTEQVSYVLNEDTKEYEPVMKSVASDFVNVAASVEGIEVDTEASKAVYTLQGIPVGDSVDNLPAGIYIVKEDTKVTKVIKGRN